MNYRKSLCAVAFLAVVAPLSAYADAPSGDADQIFPRSSRETPKPSASDRAQNTNYAEFKFEPAKSPEAKAVTREEVRKDLAMHGMAKVEA